MKTTSCYKCQQNIWWALTPNAKKIPVNVWTSPNGKIVAIDPESDVPLIRFLSKGETVEEGTRRYVSHFSTCRPKRAK